MQVRHSTGLDSAEKPVAHYQMVAGPKFLDEGPEIGEIVTVIGVAHDHVFSACAGDASHQCVAVSLPLHLNNARAQGPGDLL